MASSFFPIPITMILFVGLMGGHIDFLPTTALGAFTGFVVSKVLTPYLPKRGNQSAGSGGKSHSQASS